MTSTDDLLALEADQRRRDASVLTPRDDLSDAEFARRYRSRDEMRDLGCGAEYDPAMRHRSIDDRDAEAADRAGYQRGAVR